MYIGQPRYALVNCKPSNMEIMLLAYGDGSNTFSCGAVYIVSYEKKGMKFKTHLAVTASKMLHSMAKTGSVDTVPQREVKSALIASQLLYRVTLTLTNLRIPVTSAYLCLDAISTLLALGTHPAKFVRPFRRFLTQKNVELLNVAKLLDLKKEQIPIYVPSEQNAAEYLSKFNIVTDTIEHWRKHQLKSLKPP